MTPERKTKIIKNETSIRLRRTKDDENRKRDSRDGCPTTNGDFVISLRQAQPSRRTGVSPVKRVFTGERGIVLVTALLFLMVLTVLGTTAVMISSTDIKIGGNYKLSKQAFYDAEAGIQYAIKNIENGLAGGSLSFPSNNGDSVSVNYTVPNGFSFDNSTILTKVGTNRYRFEVTGHAANNANATIEVIIKRDSAIEYGIFGNAEVKLKKETGVYSYDSRVTPNPTPADSTHEADIGSNEKVTLKKGSYVDGDIGLGKDTAGKSAVFKDEEGAKTDPSIITGTVNNVYRVDPDPLGAVGGALAAKFGTYLTSNDNGLARITDKKIDLKKDETMTLVGKLGGANYYVTEIDLGKDATLNIDTSAGPVNVYLTGKMKIGKDADVEDGGDGTDEQASITGGNFVIYSNSKDGHKIHLKESTFRGLIYAPYAKIKIKKEGDVFGAIWGEKVTMDKGSNFFFDEAIKDNYLLNTFSQISWRQVQ
ncbi:MAG: pilus assembly PilX N-terminal domain-containing protein [Deltaproteobacteria bacterium]|nr:pilus assembly PilX N-terminal domain-containing protein [Deltaproteobacteria bacterium]